MNIRQKSVFLSLALLSTVAPAQHSASNQLIVGSTITSRQPVIINSLDGGLSWSLPFVSSLPAKSIRSELNSIYCSDKSLCLAAGSLYLSRSGEEDDRISLILRSEDNGRHWSYINLNSTAVYLKSISCLDTFCIAAGDRENNYWHYPVILTSDDGGENWKSVCDVPGKSISLAPVSTSACNSHVCVVGGQYEVDTKNAYIPLLMITTDKGQHWKQIETINHFPGGIYVKINGVKCHESICIASGQYRSSANRRVAPHSMILVSNIDGTQWTYLDHVSNSDKWLNMLATDSVCNKNSCLIVGYSGAYLYSADSGNNWELHNDVSNIPESSSSTINAVACDDDSCTAVGSYETAAGYFPLILNSSNHGLSWEFNNNIPNHTKGSLSNVHCRAQSCFAVGYVYPKNYVLISNDKGRTWIYPNTFPDLPQDYVYFNDVTSSSWVLQ